MTKYSRTFAILTDLKESGYELVTLGKPSKNNPACLSWMNGPPSIWAYHHTFDGRYNSKEKPYLCCRGSWPWVWDIARRYLAGSCGNGHQKQIIEPKTVVHGTYDLLTDMFEIKKELDKQEAAAFLEKIG